MIISILRPFTSSNVIPNQAVIPKVPKLLALSSKLLKYGVHFKALLL